MGQPEADSLQLIEAHLESVQVPSYQRLEVLGVEELLGGGRLGAIADLKPSDSPILGFEQGQLHPWLRVVDGAQVHAHWVLGRRGL